LHPKNPPCHVASWEPKKTFPPPCFFPPLPPLPLGFWLAPGIFKGLWCALPCMSFPPPLVLPLLSHRRIPPNIYFFSCSFSGECRSFDGHFGCPTTYLNPPFFFGPENLPSKSFSICLFASLVCPDPPPNTELFLVLSVFFFTLPLRLLFFFFFHVLFFFCPP